MTFRRIPVVAIVLVVSMASGAIGWAGVEPVEYIDISPSVVMAENPNGSNITCIALDDRLVFVDTGLVTELTAEFRAAMEQRFERPTTHLLLTHGHIDHIFAMDAFSDVEVVAPSAEKPLFEKQLGIEWDDKTVDFYSSVFPSFGEAVGTAKPFMPTVWVEDQQKIGSADSHVVFSTSGGHTTGSSYVWFPNERVLVAGDLVQVDKYPYFGDETNDFGSWIEALKSWYAMEPQAVCPGHGRFVDKEYLRLEWEYFEALVAALKKLKAEGVPVEKAVADPSLPEYYWPDAPEPRWWKYSIALAYRNL